MEYSFKKGLQKGVVAFVLFLLPFLIDQFIVQCPELAQLTIGSVLVMGANFLKVKYASK